MSNFAIAACGKEGCAILVNNSSQVPDLVDNPSDDPLVEKVIKSKLQIPSSSKCEVKSPSDNLNTAIIVYGSEEERKKVYGKIKDEMRSYLLSFYNVIPLKNLAISVGDFIKKIHSEDLYIPHKIEVILASWTCHNGAELYKINSNGESFKCFACAIGHQNESIAENLSKIDMKSLNVRQLLINITRISFKYSEEDDDIYLSSICDATNGRHQACDEATAKEVIKFAEI